MCEYDIELYAGAVDIRARKWVPERAETLAKILIIQFDLHFQHKHTYQRTDLSTELEASGTTSGMTNEANSNVQPFFFASIDRRKSEITALSLLSLSCSVAAWCGVAVYFTRCRCNDAHPP